jgi:hypothetical protein
LQVEVGEEVDLAPVLKQFAEFGSGSGEEGHGEGEGGGVLNTLCILYRLRRGRGVYPPPT